MMYLYRQMMKEKVVEVKKEVGKTRQLVMELKAVLEGKEMVKEMNYKEV
jgi:hypothetical protein